MKTKTGILHYLLFVSAVLLIVANSCKKEEATPEINPSGTAADLPQWRTVTDFDGNVYHTVIIGKQVWMVENLKTTRFNDGTSIPTANTIQEWKNLTSPGFCWFDNADASYKNTYGALYNWYAVNSGKLAPKGWHVPTFAEWETLTSFLGGQDIAGGKLKEKDTTYWKNPNVGATNETGFTALPNAARDAYGFYHGPWNDQGYWWSSTEIGQEAWFRSMSSGNSSIARNSISKQNGFAVRCVMDSTVTDIEGNVYKTVLIGEQLWMAENLKTTKTNRGGTMINVKDKEYFPRYGETTPPQYCWYKDYESNKITYGALYNWYAVSKDAAAPDGWRIPSNEDWNQLAIYLGGYKVAGGKLKETGDTHWTDPNNSATNESGFTALPGGERYPWGYFVDIGSVGRWWSSSKQSSLVDPTSRYLLYQHTFFTFATRANSAILFKNNIEIESFNPDQATKYMHSIRCLKK